MTTLLFPESSEDWSAAFNNGLAQGAFTDDPKQSTGWMHYELLASVVEDGEVVGDWFKQVHTLDYVCIPRSTKEIEQ